VSVLLLWGDGENSQLRPGLFPKSRLLPVPPAAARPARRDPTPATPVSVECLLTRRARVRKPRKAVRFMPMPFLMWGMMHMMHIKYEERCVKNTPRTPSIYTR
jgi:hypothetical protein